MSIRSFSLLAAFLFGCSASAVSIPIRSASGENLIGVDCKSHSQNACLAEAGNQCPGGYDVVDSEGHTTSGFKAFVNQTFGSASTTEIHNGSMLIKCHGKSLMEIEAAKREADEAAKREADNIWPR